MITLTRTAKTTDADFSDRRKQAIQEKRNFEVRVGNEKRVYCGWFYTEIEATEYRTELLQRASKNKQEAIINEIIPLK